MTTAILLLLLLLLVAPLLTTVRRDGYGSRPAPRSHHDWQENLPR